MVHWRVQVFGFFAATSAVTEGEELRLGDPAFSDAAVVALPTTLRVSVVVVYAAEPGETAAFSFGLLRPDGSRAENQHGLTVVTPGRYAHLDLPVDLFEEGDHALLLQPLGDSATVLASYPFGVALLSS